jgi:hypothetical protein
MPLYRTVKAVAASLAATGHFLSSIATLITGELLKLLVERLFSSVSPAIS